MASLFVRGSKPVRLADSDGIACREGKSLPCVACRSRLLRKNFLAASCEERVLGPDTLSPNLPRNAS